VIRLEAEIHHDAALMKDLYVELEFWRRAAERALRMWERAQDEAEDMRVLARRAATLCQGYIEVVAELDIWDEVEDDYDLTEEWFERLADDDAPEDK
jgi:hypothetical protein